VNIRPRRGGWGNPVSPSPHPVGGFGRACACCRRRRGSAGTTLPNPPRGRGLGARASGPRPL